MGLIMRSFVFVLSLFMGLQAAMAEDDTTTVESAAQLNTQIDRVQDGFPAERFRDFVETHQAHRVISILIMIVALFKVQ